MLGEDFTDVVGDAVIVIEEGSDFWNLYVAVVRTFCWTLYAVYRQGCLFANLGNVVRVS